MARYRKSRRKLKATIAVTTVKEVTCDICGRLKNICRSILDERKFYRQQDYRSETFF